MGIYKIPLIFLIGIYKILFIIFMDIFKILGMYMGIYKIFGI